MTTQLAVTPRTTSGKAVRNEGLLPGVVYGPKQEPLMVAMPKIVFEKTLAEAGESTIITLTGLNEEVEVLIHDVSFNSARGGVEHVDFYAIERGKELTTSVVLEFIGEAPVEKEGATVNRALDMVEVTCRPSNLPSHIDVDVSGMQSVDDQIMVADLKAPEGVTINTDPEMPVAIISAARDVEAETAESEEVDMDAVEVEEKGKDEGEEKPAD